MTFNVLKEKFVAISYIFFSSFVSGVILIGIGSSFSRMLSERGVGIATITHILFATIPYSWKFVMSPFIKNLILKRGNSNFNILKIISYISQIVIFLGFSLLGYLGTNDMLWMATVTIFLVVIAVSAHDILKAHMKLVAFSSKDFGFISAVENTGYRLGMFMSGVCLIYMTNAVGWSGAFVIASFTVVFATFATFFVSAAGALECASNEKPVNSFAGYFKTGHDFLKTSGFFTLLILIISFKLTNGCINVVKPIFLHSLGVSRIAYANMSYFYGLVTMIIGGVVAGAVLCKWAITTCAKATFIMQAVISVIFTYLAIYKSDLLTIAVIVGVTTFVFGFGSVVFRTFTAEKSRRDVNTYAMLLSIGSLIRIVSYSFTGFVVENYSWYALFIICLLSNIPGYLCSKRICKPDKFL